MRVRNSAQHLEHWTHQNGGWISVWLVGPLLLGSSLESEPSMMPQELSKELLLFNSYGVSDLLFFLEED
ncbi:hypothetical protein LaLC_57670 [Bacillus anthracis]|uniref:Uncharacterized protein n=1 Tax=Bacillus anthracis TaxID=1392 RepID=A0A640MM44_BACAN|nr:hypothetical protein LaLC_57670 [Bacillus anthracis]